MADPSRRAFLASLAIGAGISALPRPLFGGGRPPRPGALSATLPTIAGGFSDHARSFVLACHGLEKSRSPFETSGPLTQVFLSGIIAQRLGGRLAFDPGRREFRDNRDANALLSGPTPRLGWEEYWHP